MKKTQIRLSGTGGQGIISAGIILGEGAVLDGWKVIQTQSYGPEARGGASKAEVIISDAPILYPKVIRPDYLVLLSAAAVQLYAEDVSPDGLVLIDSSLLQDQIKVAGKMVDIPILRLASEEIGAALTANIVALGALVAATRIISREAIEKAIKLRLFKSADMNIKAFRLGWDSVIKKSF